MKIRQLVSVFLALLFVLAGVRFDGSSAKAEREWTPGNLSWNLSEDGTLTIAAADPAAWNNSMNDFDSEEPAPWQVDDQGNDIRHKVKKLVIKPGVRNCGEYAFDHCKNLTTVEMAPDSVEAIGACAFRNCTKLKTIRFSENLKEIQYEAFMGCSRLSSVTLPASLQQIGGAAFAHCGLTSVKVPEGTVEKTWDFFYPQDNYSVFLYHISLPANVQHVNYGAFAYNPLPHDTPECILPQGTTVINAETFAGAGVRYVWLSEDTTAIGSGAFVGSGLQAIYIPWGCQQFGDNALPEGTAVLSYGASNPLKEYVRTYGLKLLELEDPDGGNG